MMQAKTEVGATYLPSAPKDSGSEQEDPTGLGAPVLYFAPNIRPETQLDLGLGAEIVGIAPKFSDSDSWYSPPDLVEGARLVLGQIDLDPCSSAAANQVIKATNYYSLEEGIDGLSQPWQGRIWLNPPYSDPSAWTERLVERYQSGSISAGMCLVNASTGSRWFQGLARVAPMRLDLQGRLNFWHPNKPSGNNRYDSVLFYFGSQIDLFTQVFARYGLIYGCPQRLGAEKRSVAPKSSDWVAARRQVLLAERAELKSQGIEPGSLYQKYSNGKHSYWRHQYTVEGRRRTRDHKSYPRELAEGIRRRRRVEAIERELRQLGGV